MNKQLKRYKIIGIFLASLVIFSLFYNNYNLYNSPILKVTNVETSKTTQTISGYVVNDSTKPNITINNEFHKDLIYTDKISKGNLLFLSENMTSIEGVKRDYIIIGLFLILIDLLILVGGLQGFFTFIGLAINTLLFGAMLTFYSKGGNILVLAIILSLIFSAIVLCLINGFNRRTLTIYTSVLIAVTAIALMCAAIIYFGPKIDYDFLDYMSIPNMEGDSNLLLLSEIIIGSLGVIIDISVTITTCTNEILEKNPRITSKELIFSVRELADDITGTMINVVFFTNLGALLPVYIISVKNDIHFMTVIKQNAYFEITRFLTGSIGIILAIPISIFVAKLFKERGKKQ